MARLKGPTRRIARRVKSSSVKCAPLALIIHGRKRNMKTLEIHFFFLNDGGAYSLFRRPRFLRAIIFERLAEKIADYPRCADLLSRSFFRGGKGFFFCSFRSRCEIRSNVDSVDNRTGANLIGRSACRT